MNDGYEKGTGPSEGSESVGRTGPDPDPDSYPACDKRRVKGCDLRYKHLI